jgi:lipid-A-disaccharide synthase-like uncharacterized protein
VFELLGITGIAISVLAYLPQVVHLAREHCSAGVSSRAWTMWLLSSVLIGALALHRHDLVFVLLQISTLTSAAIILSLAQRTAGWSARRMREAIRDKASLIGVTKPRTLGEADAFLRDSSMLHHVLITA